MTVSSNIASVKLNLVLNHGINSSTGKSVSKTRTFSKIKLDASDENLYAAAMSLASLQVHPVVSMSKTVTYDIYEE